MAKIKVTEDVFKAVKQLQKGGATIEESAGYFDIAHATISRIRACATYDAYMHSRKKEKQSNETNTAGVIAEISKPVNPTVVRVEATHYMMQEMQKTNELLKAISNKLAFIVEELTGVKTNA